MTVHNLHQVNRVVLIAKELPDGLLTKIKSALRGFDLKQVSADNFNKADIESLGRCIFLCYTAQQSENVALVKACAESIDNNQAAILAITDSDVSARNLELLDAGAFDFIANPFESIVLVAKLRNRLDYLDLTAKAISEYEKTFKQERSLAIRSIISAFCSRVRSNLESLSQTHVRLASSIMRQRSDGSSDLHFRKVDTIIGSIKNAVEMMRLLTNDNSLIAPSISLKELFAFLETLVNAHTSDTNLKLSFEVKDDRIMQEVVSSQIFHVLYHCLALIQKEADEQIETCVSLEYADSSALKVEISSTFKSQAEQVALAVTSSQDELSSSLQGAGSSYEVMADAGKLIQTLYINLESIQQQA